MKVMMTWLVFLMWMFVGFNAAQAEEKIVLKTVNITLDQVTLKKGMSVFADACMGCHSLRYMTWKKLMDYPEIGFSRKEVDELRDDAPLNARIMTSLTATDAMASYGIVPPDLSIIARAREGHGAYIYSLLTGFAHDPNGRIPDGNYNLYFPGHNIAMPDPLSWLDHDPEDEDELKEQVRTVSSFLVFVGEPHQIQRQAMGRWVMAFLVLLTIVLYALKREVWKDVKH